MWCGSQLGSHSCAAHVAVSRKYSHLITAYFMDACDFHMCFASSSKLQNINTWEQPHSPSLSRLHPQGMNWGVEWRSQTVRTWLSLGAVHNVLSCGVMSAFRSNARCKYLPLFCRSLFLHAVSHGWVVFCATVIMWREGPRSKVSRNFTHDTPESEKFIHSLNQKHCFSLCRVMVAGWRL